MRKIPWVLLYAEIEPRNENQRSLWRSALHSEDRITVQSIAVKSDTIQGDVEEMQKPWFYHLYACSQGYRD